VRPYIRAGPLLFAPSSPEFAGISRVQLARPLGRGIAQTHDADTTRQSPLDRSLREFGREEGGRYCHIDLSNAAFVTRSDVLDTGDGADNDLIKPMPAAPDRRDERGAGLGAYRSTVVSRRGGRHDDFASPFHWCLFHRMRMVGRPLSAALGRPLDAAAFSSTTN